LSPVITRRYTLAVSQRGVAAAAAATRNFGMRRFAILGKVNNEL